MVELRNIEFDFAPVAPTIEERFESFHRENPHIYDELLFMALRLKHRGRKRYGIATLFEVLRYKKDIESTGSAGFKLNNDFRALYARRLMNNEPELRGFFEIRRRRA